MTTSNQPMIGSDNASYNHPVKYFLTVGLARSNDLLRGGKDWAAFRDWCHVAAVPSDLPNLMTWLEITEREITEKQRGRLFVLAGGPSDEQ